MSFKRENLPSQFATKDELSKDMAAIGFLITAEGSENPNIENTLIAASIEGLQGDLRTLSLLVNWLEIHHAAINADRLTKMIRSLQKDKILVCFWSATAKNILTDPRFMKLRRLYKGKQLDLLDVGMDFQVGRHGEDPRFKGSCLRAPGNVLRNRPRDILEPSRLAKINSNYRYRIIIGPSYKADQWALLEKFSELTPSKLAKLSYSSFGSAWATKKNFETLL